MNTPFSIEFLCVFVLNTVFALTKMVSLHPMFSLNLISLFKIIEINNFMLVIQQLIKFLSSSFLMSRIIPIGSATA